MKHKDIGRQLSEINHLIHRRMLRLSQTEKNNTETDFKISTSGSCIIAYLHDHSDKDVFQRDIEQEFQVRRSTVSSVLSLLEQNGYIERIAVQDDHRLKKIVLTQKACAVVDKIKSDRAQLEQRIVCGISDDELEIFKQTLNKIKQNLKEVDIV